MTNYINTAQDYLNLRDQIDVAYIKSRKNGKVPVPCANVMLVAKDLIIANNYNPNHVAKDKMLMLKQSILDNGFCFPIVTIWNEEEEVFVIVDGFHRDTIGDKEWLDLDYIPVVVVPHDMSKRLVATMQFNKARGVHQVDLDAEVIRALIGQGMDDEAISLHLGIDLDTIARYKQLTGIAELFSKSEYSVSWDMQEKSE